ncbi:hypothetical protein RFI_10218 [Reticulomyxa filosa]|uniref:Uncharacterized protein n=1 Tax=Reticulomyxa filosa TaxID=46433 RepID=X6NKW9_RETFI|nr:hypothetical protein RFI_10218 [Reticulomyxa filosa]|eukprot:ETO26915.1 hypothetical protein RFI_10218 [Reticulomyxa filosa]
MTAPNVTSTSSTYLDWNKGYDIEGAKSTNMLPNEQADQREKEKAWSNSTYLQEMELSCDQMWNRMNQVCLQQAINERKIWCYYKSISGYAPSVFHYSAFLRKTAQILKEYQQVKYNNAKKRQQLQHSEQRKKQPIAVFNVEVRKALCITFLFFLVAIFLVVKKFQTVKTNQKKKSLCLRDVVMHSEICTFRKNNNKTKGKRINSV